MRRAPLFVRLLVLGLALLITACAARTEPYRLAERPDTPGYLSSVPAGTTAYDNQSLADLLVRLTFNTENGNTRTRIHRLEEPVRVGLTGPGSDQYRPFMQDFLKMLAEEADIDIALGAPPYGIHIRFVPGAVYKDIAKVQCNLLFWQPSWDAFVRDPKVGPRDGGGSPSMGIFIPDTLEPVKIRECLIEETVQSLGPINDLFGLGPTIFNDDAGHTWPTRIDLLMLRVLYDPNLDADGSAASVGAQARDLLDQLNPQGARSAPLPQLRQDAFQSLRDRIITMTDDELGAFNETRAIARQVRARFPRTAYHCTGERLFANAANNMEDWEALDLIDGAIEVCKQVHGDRDPRVAQLMVTRAFALLRDERNQEALLTAERALPILFAHGQDDAIAGAKTVQFLARFRISGLQPDRDELRALQQWIAYTYGADHDLAYQLGY